MSIEAKDHRLNRRGGRQGAEAGVRRGQELCQQVPGRTGPMSAACLLPPQHRTRATMSETIQGGLHYIVMELVEGITLKTYIAKKGKLEIRETIGIAMQVAQGIEAAHEQHIVHRDIKPQNIIISRDGKVKVTDFGIAKAATSETITSEYHGFCPLYLSGAGERRLL